MMKKGNKNLYEAFKTYHQKACPFTPAKLL